MHIVILVLVLVIVYLVLTRKPGDSGDTGSVVSGHTMAGRLAFIARGKVFLRDDNSERLREIHSPHVQEIMDRIEQRKQRHGWKEGTAFSQSFTGHRRQSGSDTLEIKATSVEFAPDNALLYFLRDDSFGGLFRYDIEKGEERRLIHKQKLFFDCLNVDSENDRILCAQVSGNGVSNIVVMTLDGDEYREVTGGDTIDTAPASVPGEPTQIVFQSSGIARAETGHVIAQGPSSLQLLDLTEGSLEPIVEDDKTDYLHPRVSPEGDLYYIRRPFELPSYSGSSFLVDFILFPFRLLRAVFHYLNFFSLMYTRKPLTSASGPLVEADLKDILVKGKRIDAENAARKLNRLHGVPSLVPKTWQLIRRDQSGREEILATNVAAYDLTSGGQVLYSNGYGVFALMDDARSAVVLRDTLIAEVVVE